MVGIPPKLPNLLLQVAAVFTQQGVTIGCRTAILILINMSRTAVRLSASNKAEGRDIAQAQCLGPTRLHPRQHIAELKARESGLS